MSQRASQTRIVLDKRHLPLADHILQETGISNYSQLTAILLVNYGEYLVKSLKREVEK